MDEVLVAVIQLLDRENLPRGQKRKENQRDLFLDVEKLLDNRVFGLV